MGCKNCINKDKRAEFVTEVRTTRESISLLKDEFITFSKGDVISNFSNFDSRYSIITILGEGNEIAITI